jgi:hypothetical protein
LGRTAGRRPCVSMLAEYPRSASYVAVTILSRCAREEVSRPTNSPAPVAALKFSTMICYRRSVESPSLDVKRRTFRRKGRSDRNSGDGPLRPLGLDVHAGRSSAAAWRGLALVLLSAERGPVCPGNPKSRTGRSRCLRSSPSEQATFRDGLLCSIWTRGVVP